MQVINGKVDRFKAGQAVLIVSGYYKGKTGTILEANGKDSTAVVRIGEINRNVYKHRLEVITPKSHPECYI